MQPSIDGIQIDPGVVKVMKALQSIESGGNYRAVGDGGAAYGAFQYNEKTGPGWKNIAKQYLGDENAPMDRANQNKATYLRIKQWKDEGLQPEEIAARWNGASKDANGRYVYNNPEYGERFRQALLGSGGSYTPPPPPPAPYTAPNAEPEQPVNPLAEVGKGVAKGALGTVVDVGRMGEGILNQTVGRGVNALIGKGFTPLTPEQRINSPFIEGSQYADTTDEKLSSQNKYQTGGKVAEAAAEFLVPSTLGTKALLEARRLMNVGADALRIVAPKMTKKTVTTALKSGLGSKSGTTVGLDADQRTLAAAQAIEGLVRKGALKAKDTVEHKANTVLDEIGNVAQTLRNDLRSQEIQPLLTPEDLQGLIDKTKTTFDESPLLVGDAGKAAKRIFNKFVGYLPKGRDITAEDLLNARQSLDGWMKSQGRGTAFDPKTENAISMGLREIRQGANELLAQKAPDVKVRELLDRQTALYNALDAIVENGWKQVGTSGLERLAKNHPFAAGVAKHVAGGLIPFGAGAYAINKLTGD